MMEIKSFCSSAFCLWKYKSISFIVRPRKINGSDGIWVLWNGASFDGQLSFFFPLTNKGFYYLFSNDPLFVMNFHGCQN